MGGETWFAVGMGLSSLGLHLKECEEPLDDNHRGRDSSIGGGPCGDLSRASAENLEKTVASTNKQTACSAQKDHSAAGESMNHDRLASIEQDKAQWESLSRAMAAVCLARVPVSRVHAYVGSDADQRLADDENLP